MVLSTILTPAIAFGVVVLAVNIGNATWGTILVIAAFVATAGVLYAIVHATPAGPRRQAVMTGMLAGVGVCVLLVGACFVYVIRTI